MKEAGLVMVGGAGGALARYLVHLLALRLGGSGLGAIFAVNVSGSLALGFLLAFALSRGSFPAGLQLLIGVGFLSSYTTFSTFMWDSFRLTQSGSLLTALLNISGSLAAGLNAVALGFLAGRIAGQAIQ